MPVPGGAHEGLEVGTQAHQAGEVGHQKGIHASHVASAEDHQALDIQEQGPEGADGLVPRSQGGGQEVALAGGPVGGQIDAAAQGACATQDKTGGVPLVPADVTRTWPSPSPSKLRGSKSPSTPPPGRSGSPASIRGEVAVRWNDASKTRIHGHDSRAKSRYSVARD
jgi:hypothetical protein